MPEMDEEFRRKTKIKMQFLQQYNDNCWDLLETKPQDNYRVRGTTFHYVLGVLWEKSTTLYVLTTERSIPNCFGL